MYVKNAAIGGLGGGAAASLPFTGINIVWYLLAAFTLIAAGLALLRLLPKPVPAGKRRGTGMDG